MSRGSRPEPIATVGEPVGFPSKTKREANSFPYNKDTLAEEFLRYLTVERNASPRTLKAYRQALSAFRGNSQKPWKKCTPDDFRDYLFAIMKSGQARSYVRLQFSALRALQS